MFNFLKIRLDKIRYQILLFLANKKKISLFLFLNMSTCENTGISDGFYILHFFLALSTHKQCLKMPPQFTVHERKSDQSDSDVHHDKNQVKTPPPPPRAILTKDKSGNSIKTHLSLECEDIGLWTVFAKCQQF